MTTTFEPRSKKDKCPFVARTKSGTKIGRYGSKFAADAAVRAAFVGAGDGFKPIQPKRYSVVYRPQKNKDEPWCVIDASDSSKTKCFPTKDQAEACAIKMNAQ